MLSPEIIKKVRRLHIKTNHLVTTTVVGNYHTAFRGKGMEFQEVRQYVVGDDVRDVDWNVTARLGAPYVKIFQEERELTVMLLVDMSASGKFGSRGQLKRNLIAEVAAVLAFSAIKNNDKVGLVLFTDKVERVVLPKKGRGHVWRVIRELLNFEPQSNKTDLRVALTLFNRIARRRGVAFMLSDFIDDKSFREPLAVAARRHDFIALQVTDPLERDLGTAGIGWVNLQDPESGKTFTLPSHHSEVRRLLRQNSAAKQEKLMKLLHRSGARHVELDCTRDYMPALVKLFGRRKASL